MNFNRESIETIKEYERQMATQSWSTFKAFLDCAFGLWKVVMVPDDWLQSSCTCPIYHKKYVCKHIIGIALMEKLAVCPIECKSQPLGVKKTRGRTALSVQALLRQPRDSILNAGFSDDEDDDDNNGNEAIVENVTTFESFIFDTPENSNDIWSALTVSSIDSAPIQAEVNETELDDLLQSILAVELPPVVIIPSSLIEVDTTTPAAVAIAVTDDEPKKRGRKPLSAEEKARRDEIKQRENDEKKRLRDEAREVKRAAKRSKNA
jgi:hypothetical protein